MLKKTVGTSKFEYTEDPLRNVLRTSWGHLESTSQGCPWNVRLGHPLDIISGRPQNVRLRRPQDVRSAPPRDGQIGSLGDVLVTFQGDILGKDFDWFDRFMFHKTKNKNKKGLCKSFLQCFISKNVWQSIKMFVWALMVCKIRKGNNWV